MSTEFIPAERQRVIGEMLTRRGVVTVSELSQIFKVSEITIRRDLDILEGKGVLERTHGGAIGSRRISSEPLYDEKNQVKMVEKSAIGAAAAALVEPGDTILVNSGSTNVQVIRHIAAPAVRLITSNAGAVLAAPSGVELVLVGGLYRPQSNSFVGGFAALTLEQVYGSKTFIGIDGVSFKYGLTTPNHQEAEIGRLMIDRTRGPVIVVADHTKLGVVSNFLTAHIDEVDVLVTDQGFEEEYRSDLENAGVRIIIARPTADSEEA